MDNKDFLHIITEAFRAFLKSGSRSNEKLKILHGAIAEDLHKRLGDDYEVCALGYKEGKEEKIRGRYIDKVVDITVKHNGVAVAGVSVKFVMQNYAQNSNNYFENMLGETANIRSAKTPYFQILIIPDILPYYDNEGVIKHYDEFTTHNAEKYIALSQDDAEMLFHTPSKTLLFVIHLNEPKDTIHTKKQYISFYSKQLDITLSQNAYGHFDRNVIYNDYNTFIDKVMYGIKAI